VQRPPHSPSPDHRALALPCGLHLRRRETSGTGAQSEIGGAQVLRLHAAYSSHYLGRGCLRSRGIQKLGTRPQRPKLFLAERPLVGHGGGSKGKAPLSMRTSLASTVFILRATCRVHPALASRRSRSRIIATSMSVSVVWIFRSQSFYPVASPCAAIRTSAPQSTASGVSLTVVSPSGWSRIREGRERNIRGRPVLMTSVTWNSRRCSLPDATTRPYTRGRESKWRRCDA
jgi:hypothetical protein